MASKLLSSEVKEDRFVIIDETVLNDPFSKHPYSGSGFEESPVILSDSSPTFSMNPSSFEFINEDSEQTSPMRNKKRSDVSTTTLHLEVEFVEESIPIHIKNDEEHLEHHIQSHSHTKFTKPQNHFILRDSQPQIEQNLSPDTDNKLNPIPEDTGTHSDDIGLSPEEIWTYPDEIGLSPEDIWISPDEIELSPKSIRTHPDEIGLSPEDIRINTDEIGLSPEIIRIYPDQIELSPKSIRTHPEEIEFSPEDFRIHSDEIELNPEDIRIHPDEIELSPENIRIHLDEIEFSPEVIRIYPDEIEFSPEDISTHLDETKLNPVDIRIHLDETEFSPVDISIHLDETKLNPVDISTHLNEIGLSPVDRNRARKSVVEFCLDEIIGESYEEIGRNHTTPKTIPQIQYKESPKSTEYKIKPKMQVTISEHETKTFSSKLEQIKRSSVSCIDTTAAYSDEESNLQTEPPFLNTENKSQTLVDPNQESVHNSDRCTESSNSKTLNNLNLPATVPKGEEKVTQPQTSNQAPMVKMTGIAPPVINRPKGNVKVKQIKDCSRCGWCILF